MRAFRRTIGTKHCGPMITMYLRRHERSRDDRILLRGCGRCSHETGQIWNGQQAVSHGHLVQWHTWYELRQTRSVFSLHIFSHTVPIPFASTDVSSRPSSDKFHKRERFEAMSSIQSAYSKKAEQLESKTREELKHGLLEQALSSLALSKAWVVRLRNCSLVAGGWHCIHSTR